jgi:hypothetical protein
MKCEACLFTALVIIVTSPALCPGTSGCIPQAVSISADQTYQLSVTAITGWATTADFGTADPQGLDQGHYPAGVRASGFSYEEADKIYGCTVGTIKSRVNRTRQRLADLLHIESVDDFGREAQQRGRAHPRDRVNPRYVTVQVFGISAAVSREVFCRCVAAMRRLVWRNNTKTY